MQYRIRRNSGKPDNAAGPAQSESWERNTLRDVLVEAYEEQRRARFWRNIWRCVALAVFLALVFGVGRSGGTGNMSAVGLGKHTAVIDLKGEIGGDNEQTAMLRTALKAAYGNSSVKGIIIRANSPGGSPVVANTAFNEVRLLKAQHKNIPLYVVAEDICTSGCYYIAAAADKIYADPSSIVGSIGVIGGGFDASGLLEKLGVKRRLKTSGSNKGMGDPFTPETPEQARIWQEMLNDIHGEFIKAVKTGRGSRINEQTHPDIFSGRVYTGNEAKKAGLIDGFGSIYSIARDEIKAPELVDYTPEEDFGKLLGRRLGAEVAAGVEQMFRSLR